MSDQSDTAAGCFGLIGILLVGSCVFGGGSEQPSSSPAEAAVTAAPALAEPATESDDATFVQAKDSVAALINLNGHLCAVPVDVRPLKMKQGVFEVTCIEYRGGSGKVRYLVDGNSGTASRL